MKKKVLGSAATLFVVTSLGFAMQKEVNASEVTGQEETQQHTQNTENPVAEEPMETSTPAVEGEEDQKVVEEGNLKQEDTFEQRILVETETPSQEEMASNLEEAEGAEKQSLNETDSAEEEPLMETVSEGNQPIESEEGVKDSTLNLETSKTESPISEDVDQSEASDPEAFIPQSEKTGGDAAIILPASKAVPREAQRVQQLKANEVIIPDKTLESSIKKYLNISENTIITQEDMLNLEVVIIARITSEGETLPPVKSLEGLQYAKNLKRLFVNGSGISDLVPIQNLLNLEELEIIFSDVSDVTPLAGLRNLTTLKLSYNHIFDITPLEHFLYDKNVAVNVANQEVFLDNQIETVRGNPDNLNWQEKSIIAIPDDQLKELRISAEIGFRGNTRVDEKTQTIFWDFRNYNLSSKNEHFRYNFNINSGLFTRDYHNSAFTGTVKRNVSFVKESETEKHQVVFNSNGGSTVEPQYVEEGQMVQEPIAPTKEGSTFKGWSTDEDGDKIYAFTTPVKGALSLYAQWEENQPSETEKHQVVFNSNGGSAVEPQYVEDGETVQEPTTPTKGGSTFKGWSTDEAGDTIYAFTTPVKGALTLYAQWEKVVVSEAAPPPVETSNEEELEVESQKETTQAHSRTIPSDVSKDTPENPAPAKKESASKIVPDAKESPENKALPQTGSQNTRWLGTVGMVLVTMVAGIFWKFRMKKIGRHSK
ncbi:MAG: InlB B-repeat-containing protein [Enterococcus sp.]|uniref:InlB B-repeat-containing protein n=1 Tax=Enterococcus sp. TaxID=35783 RepID=UPI0026492340|nr:InlB B-repeat-containing protein [Enterococcus sp.]MDN6004796.1 InlB B-repeat-containing protein [Enterococcus sp.]MDN6517802.1 InlB B-repeat-containing protein [Enterococcus sp.]MDN6778420.1 InlB B-repeat-containing protein [Enterococcus sp.]